MFVVCRVVSGSSPIVGLVPRCTFVRLGTIQTVASFSDSERSRSQTRGVLESQRDVQAVTGSCGRGDSTGGLGRLESDHTHQGEHDESKANVELSSG